MRRLGLWVIALCVGYTAVAVYGAVIDHFFGVVTGARAVAYNVGLVLVFAAGTSLVVAWLDLVKPDHVSARVRN